MRSPVFLREGSRSTARTSLRATRSLLSALETGFSHYINVTTGVVNITGGVVTVGSGKGCLIVFGPRVVDGFNRFRARRNYLSLSNRHGAIHCGAVGMGCFGRGFGRVGHDFSSFATRVVRRRVSRYGKVLVWDWCGTFSPQRSRNAVYNYQILFYVGILLRFVRCGWFCHRSRPF